jgi:hypothetical protein
LVDEAVAATAPAAAPSGARSTEAEFEGALVTRANTRIESVPTTVDDGNVKVTGIVTATPVRAVVTSVAVIAVAAEAPKAFAAGDVTNESMPKLKAETATSAMRLRVVFVDIDFLSIVDFEAFPKSAW